MLEYIKDDDPLVSVGSFLPEECMRLQVMLEGKGIVCYPFGSQHGDMDYYGNYSVKQLCIKKSDVAKALPVVEKFKLSL